MPACQPALFNPRPRSCEFFSLLFRAVRSTTTTYQRAINRASNHTLVKVSLILVSILMLFLPLRVLSKSDIWLPLAHDRPLDSVALSSAAGLQQPGVSTAHGLLTSLSVHKSITSVFQPSNLQFRSCCTAHDIRVGPFAIFLLPVLLSLLTCWPTVCLLLNSDHAAELSLFGPPKPCLTKSSQSRHWFAYLLRSDYSAHSLPVR